MRPGLSAKQPTHFGLLVEEKLVRLSQRNRLITEKRIMDLLFEREINEFERGFIKLCKLINYPLFREINFQINLHYI